jgi:4-hydroxythreonine-4-phosphate dehydrogenase
MRKKRSLPTIGVSQGDPSGIGAEVLLKALRDKRVHAALTPVVFGDASLSGKVPKEQLVVVSRLAPKDRRPGKPTAAGASAQFEYFYRAVASAKRLDGLCTGPVSKEQITKVGIPFSGHTEALGVAFGVETLMLMDGPGHRIALATNHLAIKDVPRALTRSVLSKKLTLLSDGLRPLLGRKPRIAVLALNPHAGDGGVMGVEEKTVIAPTIAFAQRAGIACEGPFAADGFFPRLKGSKFDAVLAMFHDQGLVAAKLLDFRHTVNVTLGLPWVRTSPDHGVAYDIAGKGKADAEPMVQALLKAAKYAGISRKG